MTVLPFRTQNDAAAAVPVVAEHLSTRGLLAYPTETVYGLGSRASEGDIEALLALKGRPKHKPFLLLVSSRHMAESRGLEFTPAASLLAQDFWPGPLTLVLPGVEGRLPDELRGLEGGIAVRQTSHENLAFLIRELGEPLTSTSANRPGEPTAPSAREIENTFRTPIATGDLMLLDGGILGNGPPSTLVDCTGGEPTLIREGAITREELASWGGSFAQ